jgi:hypothetical protein
MAVPTPAGSLPRAMPAASSSLIDPAIGQLPAATRSLGQERARLLPVLAALPA